MREPRKYGNLIVFLLKYSYLNIFYTLNILSSLKCFCNVKVCYILNLHQTISRRYLNCQETVCQKGGKKFEKANDLGNSRYTSFTRPSSYKFGNKLNSIHLNLNLKASCREFCAQNSPLSDRPDNAAREWPNNKLLVKFKREVTQEQIALVNLAKLKGLHDKAVKRRQTILLRSLKFRIIAVYKIFQSKGAKTPGVNNISFTSDLNINKKICSNMVEQLKETVSNPKKYNPLSVKRIWLPKTKCKKRPIRISTILDKALQQLIYLVLEPLVECISDFNSFGFRKYRSAKMAIGVLRELLKTLDKDYVRTLSFKQLEQGVPIILDEDK